MAKNKIIIITIIAIFAFAVLIGGYFLITSKSSSKKDDGNIEEEIRSITENIFAEGCVPDEGSAAEIAAVILKSVYGENFDNGLPLVVNFDDVKQEWLIRTQLPKDMCGGSKYIIIKKSNAEVVAIWATK